jgi:hypothetical protein
MDITRLLKPGLFIYECARFMLLAAALAFIQSADINAFPWLAYTASNALFPLMTLFLWVNMAKYGAYLPLFLAGKFIGSFSITGWVIISRAAARSEELTSFAFNFAAPRLIAGFLICADLFAIVLALIIYKNTHMTVAANTETFDKGEQI